MKLVWLIKTRLNETYTKVHTGKGFFKIIPIPSGLKQEDGLFPLLSNCTSQYCIRIVQENQVGLKLNGTH
jgi:hypothetical protein